SSACSTSSACADPASAADQPEEQQAQPSEGAGLAALTGAVGDLVGVDGPRRYRSVPLAQRPDDDARGAEGAGPQGVAQAAELDLDVAGADGHRDLVADEGPAGGLAAEGIRR